MNEPVALVQSVNALGRAQAKMARTFSRAIAGELPDWWRDEEVYWERWYAFCAVGHIYSARLQLLAEKCEPWFNGSAFVE